MNLRAILLSPFAFINALVLRLRHFCFDIGILPSKATEFKLIKVGNLAFGGTGKTPFTEYLIAMLQEELKLGVVSRGYGRTESSTSEVLTDSLPELVGDEPLQIKQKFPHVHIFVNSKRTKAISKLMEKYPETDVIILDDALQHRSLKNGMQILLTAAQKPFTKDFLFPSGYLRDIRTRASQVDAIVLTKIDENINVKEEQRALKKYSKPIFFSRLEYELPRHINSDALLDQQTFSNGLIITGIASPVLLLDHVKKFADNCTHLKFRDHHKYTEKDIQRIHEIFNSFSGPSVIFTTEKDAVKLKSHVAFESIHQLPIYVVKIKIHLLENEEALKKLLLDYVGKN